MAANPSAFVARAREVLARATPGPLKYGLPCPRTGFTLVSAKGHVADVMEVNGGLTRAEALANAEKIVLGWNRMGALLDVAERAMAMHEWANWSPTNTLCRACVSYRDEGHMGDCPVAALDSALAWLEVPE